MDGKGYISNPYLSVSTVMSKSYKILIEDAVKKEFEKLKEELTKEITEEVYKKIKGEIENLRRDEWERIGSPDIK